MIKGFYSAASAMVTGMQRQNVLAHNIANLETPGFRKTMIAMEEWYKSPVRYDTQVLIPQMPVNYQIREGYISLGVDTTPEIIDFSQGTVKSTNEELDFAINGAGFFRIRTPDGERYTRDGRFLRDANRNLVTVEGHFVLNTAGAQITLPDAPVRVDENGNITNALTGANITQIGLAAFNDPTTELARSGNNNFVAANGITGTTPSHIEQGYLEMSNASATQLLASTRAYEAAQKIVQINDQNLGRLLSSLSSP